MTMDYNSEDDKHCSMCKYYYCSPNHQMICFYGNISKKITARRKNGCKHFENVTKKSY